MNEGQKRVGNPPILCLGLGLLRDGKVLLIVRIRSTKITDRIHIDGEYDIKHRYELSRK